WWASRFERSSCSLNVSRRSPQTSASRSPITSTSDSKMSARLYSTTAASLHRVRGEHRAEREQLPGRAAELVLDLLAPDEVAVQRVVEVDTQTTVQMLGGVHDPGPAVAGPELRDRDRLVGRPSFGQPPDRLQRGEPDQLGVNVGVSGTLTDCLERRDLLVELLALRRVLCGHRERLG